MFFWQILTKRQISNYQKCQLKVPSLKQLQELSKDLKFNDQDTYLKTVQDVLKNTLTAYSYVGKNATKIKPSKYSRVAGHRPTSQENKNFAWAWRCDIKGADTGTLAGLKVAIKDNISVAGMPMVNGSAILEDYIPDSDATVVERLLGAGAQIVGKTACEDLCFSGVGFNTSLGSVENPYKPSHVCGGSSSGSAVALVNGDVDLAIGGDQGGSIRIPSSWCGVVGLKPTYGLVPYTGAASIEYTLDHLGPMARDVETCALSLDAIAGLDESHFDGRQPNNLKYEPCAATLRGDLKGVKIALVREGFHGIDEGVDDFIRQKADLMKKAGATVENVSVPIHFKAMDILTPVLIDGTLQNLWENGGQALGTKDLYLPSLMNHMHRGKASRAQDVGPVLKYYLYAGAYVKQYYGQHFYGHSRNLIRILQGEYDKVLSHYDALLMPTLPMRAFEIPHAEASDDELLNVSTCMLGNTAPFNATGHPSISLNGGFIDSLPIGAMFTAKHFNEAKLLNIALGFEKL